MPLARAVIRLVMARRRQPGVAAVILHERRVLLFQHVFWTAARWGLPGGGIEGGEAAEDAVRREVREECGLDVAIERRLFTSASGATFFLCRLADGTAPSPLPRLSFEILHAEWFDPERLPDGLLPSHQRAVAAAIARG